MHIYCHVLNWIFWLVWSFQRNFHMLVWNCFLYQAFLVADLDMHIVWYWQVHALWNSYCLKCYSRTCIDGFLILTGVELIPMVQLTFNKVQCRIFFFMIVRTVFLCKKRDAMARDKIQKMMVDKVIQKLPHGLQQRGTR